MQFNDGAIVIQPQFGLAIVDTIDERDALIDKLHAERCRRIDIDTNAKKIEKKLLDEVAALKTEINNLKQVTINVNGYDNDINKEQWCIDFMTRENTVDIKFFRGKIDDVNNFLNPILQRTHHVGIRPTELESRQIEMLHAQKHLLMGEYSFNNMLAKNMGEYYCDRILHH